MESGWTIGQFIVGIIVAAIGFVLVWQADWFMRIFGAIPFAEKYLSSEGGTRLFYKLIGILIMIGGIMHATDLLEQLMSFLFKKFFGGYYK